MPKFITFSALSVVLATASVFGHSTSTASPSIVAGYNLTDLISNPSIYDKNKLIVDTDTGFVYVAARQWILQFDADLHLMASVNFVRDTFRPECSNCRHNHILVVNREFQELLHCSSSANSGVTYVNSTCTGWNLANISSPHRNYATGITHDATYTPFAFIAPGPSQAPNTTQNVLYVAASESDSPKRRFPPFASRSLLPHQNLKLMSPAHLNYKSGLIWFPVYAFSYKGFSYFLSSDTKYLSTLIRVCQNHSNLSSFAEIAIRCGGNSSSGPIARAAHIRRPGTNLIQQLNVTADAQVLFVLFVTENGDFTNLCIYSMDRIRNAFHEIQRRSSAASGAESKTVDMRQYERDFCSTQGGPPKLVTAFTAEPAISLKEGAYTMEISACGPSTVVFIGTEEATVKKFLITTPSSATKYSEEIVFPQGTIRQMALGADEQHLYLMSRTGGEVTKILLENCTSSKTHEECVDAREPFCNGCEMLNKCTSRGRRLELVEMDVDTSTPETSKTINGSRIIRFRPSEPVLLTCGVPISLPPTTQVHFIVELPNGTLVNLESNTIEGQGGHQFYAFLDISLHEGHLYCETQVQFWAEKVTYRSSPSKLEAVSDMLVNSTVYKDSDKPDSSLIIWCNDSGSCPFPPSERILDTSSNRFAFYGITLNPPTMRLHWRDNTGKYFLKLPETISMRNSTHALVRADPSEPQVLWTHSPRGHLWLTNRETRTSVVLKKDFGIVQMDVDWKEKVVFGVSEKDRKCVIKLDLKSTSSVTNFCVNEAITSIAVGREFIYYVTGSGKIVQRNPQDDSESEVFKGYPKSVPRSLVARKDGKISWAQDFFGKFSVIHTMHPQGDQKIISRHVIMKLIRGIHEKVPKRTSVCPNCSHYCKPFGRQPSCGCQWKLAERENRCSGKWVHVVTKSNLVTFDMAHTRNVSQTSSLNPAHQIKVISQDGSGRESCFLNETKAGIHFDCWKSTTDLPIIGLETILEVLKNSISAEIDVIFIQGTCIKILHVAKNQTWTLFCGKISSANVVIDTKSWVVFWEHKSDKRVYMTELPSLVIREFVNETNFELPAETPGRLALDSGSKTMYWIHGSKVWSRSYEDVAKSAPKLIWNTGNPKQLQFHDGFLYWIQAEDGGFDEIVIFDIEHGSRQTLIAASAAFTRFESFVVQSEAAKTSTDSFNCSRSNCSHFCLPPRKEDESPKCWCPNENPILTSSGECQEPVLYVVQENATTKKFELMKTQGSLRHIPAEITKEAPAGSAVFASNQIVQCWLTGPRNRVECWNSKTNVTKLVGFAHSTNPVFSLDFNRNLFIYNTGNETGKYGSFTLANVTNGETLEFEPIKEDQGSPFAFDHRRKLAVWCTDRDLQFHEVGGSHLDSHEVSIEIDYCPRNARSCTSLALDEENGRAYFIYCKRIQRLDYIQKSRSSPVKIIHELVYSYAKSLSFDGNGHLFWAGGFADFGEFVDMIRIPEKGNEVVASIRVSRLPKGNIKQVQAEREAATIQTQDAGTRKDSCDGSDCENFCFPENRWTLKGFKCYCPTEFSPEGSTSSKCAPLYKTSTKVAENKGEEKVTKIVDTENEKEDSLLKIIIGVCSGIVVLGLVIFGLIIRKRRGNQEEDYKKALTLFLDGDQYSANMIDNPAERSYYVPFSKTIPPADINLTDAKQLGSGQFGAVFLAKYKEEPVAIKVVKHGSDKEQMKEFLKEIKIMAYIGEHAHIVQMYGAEVSNLEKGGVLVVLELCSHGDLETFLRKHKNNFNSSNTAAGTSKDEVAILAEDDQNSINFSNLVDWSRQIAHGLAYLEEKQVVHGDLATRNALLFDNNVVKVSDFGFSRKTYGKQYTKANKQTPLPFRWAAPETLDQMTFSTQTDVWSYGVTVWEIFTLGNCPFAQQSWDLTFSTRLREGMRLEKPELATDEIYDRLMMHCWQINPADRPTFVQICEFWNQLL